MASNTLKTVLGYIRSLVGRFTPFELSAGSLDDIYNYLPISDTLSTSGQPTEKQFELVKAAGFERVINLAPHNAENALEDEAAALAGLGMQYTHIPVDFKKPTESDFRAFCAQMEEMDGHKVWVHCAANMRVSAFMYRYRCEVLGEQSGVARQSLSKIWEPFGVWKAFIARSGSQANTEGQNDG